ncbi:hypothetical protein ACFQLX_21185 [Streptomyces polyrhachis]|uniref:Uncharacterized protein n=1 Tax=Streptomyces polyrhachis TaxID=1282885 RepID=A0ABW2GKG6_9ACTN
MRIRYPRLRPGFGASTSRPRQPGWAVVIAPHGGGSMCQPGLVLSAGWVGSVLLGLAVAGRVNRWTLLAAFLARMEPRKDRGRLGSWPWTRGTRT